jgi:hypothetical protein
MQTSLTKLENTKPKQQTISTQTSEAKRKIQYKSASMQTIPVSQITTATQTSPMQDTSDTDPIPDTNDDSYESYDSGSSGTSEEYLYSKTEKFL